MSDLPPLVADGGELRLARKVAAYVYGRREVAWPDGVENPEDSLPDEREFGWVAKLPGPEPGLSERRFVRGDVKIDAVEQVSNVEQVLDDAESRAGGDVFFESMIEGRGLGRLKPGVDFDQGDLVDVRFWGRILPDQLVTSVEWHDGAPSVKIGGQLTSDTGELARARAEMIRLIRSERQEREDDVSEVRSTASTAQSTANTARSEVQAVRDTLAGERAQEPDLLAQLVAVNDDLQRLGQEPQPSLMLAFVSLSTALWEAQQKINQQQQLTNAQQKQINEQTREINEAQQKINQQQQLINVQQKQINEQTREINKAQSRSIELLSLYNHGALYIESSYVLNANTWRVLDFSGVRGQLTGCEPIVVQNGNSSGTGLRFLSPGDWEVNLRVTLPPGDALIGTSTAVRVVALTPGRQEIGRAKATSRNSGFDQTLSLRTTISVPEAGSYVNAQAYASTTSGASSWWPSDTGPELTELSVRQLSVAV